MRIHADDEAGAVLDAQAALHGIAADEQIHCCGPSPLMKAVATATAHLPAGRVYLEWFNAPTRDGVPEGGVGQAFEISLRRSSLTLSVGPHLSILEVIERPGIGHRDFVLSEDERAKGDIMMICVSRAANGHLLLDL